MMTWSDYVLYKVLIVVGDIALTLLLSLLFYLSRASRCAHCDRSKQLRWRKPHPLATRFYCPFHDEWAEFSERNHR